MREEKRTESSRKKILRHSRESASEVGPSRHANEKVDRQGSPGLSRESHHSPKGSAILGAEPGRFCYEVVQQERKNEIHTNIMHQQ